ncbi:MAG: class I SAM-dependent methyltransferase [Methylocystis sp.]
MTEDFDSINRCKANFNYIYAQPDPRAYYSVLGSLDYMIPDVAEPVIQQLLQAKAAREGVVPVVLDVGCSYGINAAVHRFPLSFDALRRRYARRELMELSPDELIRLDASYYSGWPDRGRAVFLGLDMSASAVDYARRVGLIEEGVVADLERDELPQQSVGVVRRANVLLSTGCIGYLGEATFAKILKKSAQPPWVISFVLRMFPYERMEAALAVHGLETERLAGATFIQRRFCDSAEFEQTLQTLESLGKDTQGLEAEGLFHADLYVSRPREEVRERPLAELVTVTSGRYRPFGPRYVHIDTEKGRRVTLEP